MMQFKLTNSQKFLCLGIRHYKHINQSEFKKLYEQEGDISLFKEAKLNGVASIIAHSLITVYGENNVPSHWIDEFNLVDSRIKKYIEELEKVATLLAEHNIPLLALKNSGITKGLYPIYGSCPMGDIDVLVSKTKFRAAHKLLTNAGYILKFRSPLEEDNIDAAEHGGGAEYSVTLDNGEHLWFELQWRPVAGRWIQPDQEPKVDDLISRSISITGSNVRLLSPEDNLLQVALHTAKHSFVRAPGFRLHTDVDRIVSTQNIDWNVFTNRVTALKTKTAVFISLAMANTLLGTPIPTSVLDTLKPSQFKLKIVNFWLEKVGIFEPDAPKWNRIGFIFFVSLLYDNSSDFIRGIFPSTKNLKEQYGFTSNLFIPYYHVKRIFNLIFRRVKT